MSRATKTKPGNGKKIAIIGGGFTGLTAAYELAKQGVMVDVFEANADLGGLASGFKLGGHSIEKTYHHIFRTDVHIIELVKELGIESSLEWLPSSVAVYAEGKLYPFMTPLDLLRFTPLSFVARVRAGVAVLFLQLYKGWQNLQQVTAYEWMQKWAGAEVTRVIWYPLIKGKFDSFYDKVSMAWLWARVHIRANSRQPGEATEKLGYFKSGFQEIVDVLAARIKQHGGRLMLKTPIWQIRAGEKGVEIQLSDGKTVKYDKAIVTAPSHIFAKLTDKSNLPVEYSKKLTGVNYLGAVVAVFTSKQKISDFYWHNINDTKAPFLVFIHHTKLVPAERYGGEYVYYIGAYLPHDHRYFGLAEKDVYAEWFDYLGNMFPDFDASQVQESHLFRLQNAQHIVGKGYGEQIPSIKTPIEGVFLSNFAQIFPEDRGTNYAVREGRRVAQIVLDELE